MKLRYDAAVTPALLQRFADEAKFEAGDGRYYGIILNDFGHPVAHHPYSPALDYIQLIWAADILRRLNRELHHDGAWVIVFTHVLPQDEVKSILYNREHAEYGRYCIMWMDHDADVQFSQEWVHGSSEELRDWATVMSQGVEAVLQKCEGSWQLWHEAMRLVLDPKPDQLYRRAKGERPPSISGPCGSENTIGWLGGEYDR